MLFLELFYADLVELWHSFFLCCIGLKLWIVTELDELDSKGA